MANPFVGSRFFAGACREDSIALERVQMGCVMGQVELFGLIMDLTSDAGDDVGHSLLFMVRL